MSTPRAHLAAGVMNGTLYAVGGEGLSTVEAYTPYEVNWSSSNTSVATIDTNGLAKSKLSSGTSTITATTGSISGSTLLTVYGPPDLVIDSLTTSPNLVAPGQTVAITAIVRNKGSVTANNFTVDLYNNLTAAPAVGQAGDVTCNVASLSGGATTACSGTVTYAVVGTYKVRAQVDTTNAVAETNEKNNLKGPVRVVVKLPDLRITKLTASTITPAVGQSVILTATVKNFGVVSAGTFNVDLYQNLASVPLASQVGDWTCNVNGLARQAATNCTTTVTYAAPGMYQAWAQTDTLSAVAESNENNNVKGPLKITVH